MSQMKRRSNAGGAASRQKSKRQSSASQRTSKRSSTTSGRASVTNEVDDTRQYQTIISEELAAKMLDAKGSRRFSSSEIDREGGEKATALPPGVEAAKSVATDLGIVQENNPDLDLRLTDFTSSQVAPARPPELYASRARGPARERRERARNKNSPIIGQRIVKKGSVDSTGLSAEPAAAKSGDNRQDAVEVDTEDDGSEEGTGLQQANSSKGSTSSLRSMVKAGAAAGHTQSHDPQQHYAGAANYTQWRDAYQKILEYQGSHPPLKILNADAKATLRKKHAAMPHAEFEAFWYRYNALHVHGFLGLDGVSLPAEHLAQDDAGLVEYQALVAASRIDGSAATLEQYLGVPLESVLPTVPHLLDELQHEMLQISAISGGNKSLGHGQLQRGSAISPTGAPIIGNVTRSISALAAGGLDQISEQRRNIDLENGVGAVIGGGGYVHFVAPGNVSSVGGAAEQRWALERGHFSDSPPLAGTLMVPTTPRGGSGSPRPGHGQQGAGKLGGGLTAALSPRPGVGGSSPTTSTTAYVPRSSTATRLSMRGVYETVAGRGGRMLQMELQEAATRAKNLEVKQGSSVRTKKPLSGPFAEVDARLAAEARERTKWKAKAALRAYHVKDPPGVGVPGPGAYAHPEEKISAKRMPAYSFERADMHIHNGRIRSSTRWAQSNKDRAFHPARRLEDSDDRHIGPGAYNIEKFGKLNILDKAVFESPGDALRRAMGLQKRHENDHAARDAASTRLTCPGCLKRFPRTTRGEQFAAHIAACPDLPKFPVMSMSAFQKTLAHLVDQPHADVASLLGLEMTPTPEHLKHSHHAHARKSGRVPHAGIMTEHGEHVVETDGMTRKPRLHRVHIQTDPKDREAEVPLEQTDFVEDIADSAKREHGSGIGRMLKIATAIGGQATAAAPHGHGAAKLHHAHAKSKSKGEKIDVDLLVGGEKHNARLRRSSLATTGLLRPRSALPEQYSPSVDQAKGVLDRNGAEALAREKRMMRQSRASRLHMGTKERRTAAPQAHGFDTFLRGGPSSSPSPASTIRATMDWGTMAARNTQRPIMAAQRTTTAVRNQGSTTSIASTTSIGSTASSAMKARATRLRATAVGAPKKGTTRLESEIGLACRYCQCRLRSEKERTLHERCICIHRPCDCPHMVHGCPVVLPACEIPAHAATCPFKDAVYDPNKALESPGARPSGVVVATLSVTRTTPAAISSPTTTVGQAKNSALLQLPTTKKKAGAFGVKNAASEKKDEDEEESDYEEEDESLGKD
ncbi:unnamed protein product [Amoebophrya sp. A25]|nr:unnamed protein product [Amoebophrya sp. A25]|eukprot:GSA25T00016543001.1